MAYPEATVDATVNKSMDMAFVNQSSFFNQTIGLANKSSQQLSNVTDNIFLQMVQLWQATSAQVLMTNRLAENILAQRSATNQPNIAPSVVEPVVVKAN
jgi:hypothetical protein